MFRSVLPAQAALFGIVLSIGPIQDATRILGASLVGALFAVVVTTLALQLDIGGLFGRHGYGWQFLMMMVRAVLIGGFYWRCLLRHGVVLSTSGEPWGDSLFRFRLLHLLVLMSLVALYFGVMRSLSGGPFYALVLVLYVVVLGCAYAIMSLLASLLALDPRHTPGKTIAYLCGILLFSLAIAWHAYEAQNGWNSAKFAWIEAMIEVAWIVGSLVALRLSGFRLARQTASSAADHVTASVLLKRSLRFSLKEFFIALTLVALWLGWNVNIVKNRERLRSSNQGTSGAAGAIAVVTYTEGDASASQQVKQRIAPHVHEAFEIRNRGGRAIGPKGSANLSFIRRWLGDEPVFLLLLDESADVRPFESVFPEAMIVVRGKNESPSESNSN